ncbi:MAG: sugar phosphate isomerase/epimerase family protein [Planctomycetia bacterium]
MLLGYGTNGIGDVDPLDAIPVLRELGYRSLAITLDRHTIDPFATDLPARIARWREALAHAGLACVIETGARHLLDPVRKHEPTLVTADREARGRRTDFLRRAVDVAVELGATCVSLWSGVVHDAADEAAIWSRLTGSLGPVLEHAAARGMPLGFEPEPGMAIDTLARYRQLLDRLGRPDHLRLTVDIGHMECMGERPPADVLRPWVDRVVNVHVDDMRCCRHEHLPLGAGDVAFSPILAALAAGGYMGGLHVELPRQSHRWVETSRESAAFLLPLLSRMPAR